MLSKWRPRPVMLDAEQYQGRVFQARGIGMLLRIRHARSAVREKPAQLVARHNHETNINASLAESRMQVDHVHHEQIAPGRDLHFNSDADPGAVYDFAFGPVDTARDFLCPSPEFVELHVD